MYIPFLYLEVPSIVLELLKLKLALHLIQPGGLVNEHVFSPKDIVNTSVTQSDSDHIHSGTLSTPHLHDNHNP